MELDVSGVTRFEVIDHTGGEKLDEHGLPAFYAGLALSRRGVEVTLSLQDDGRTLKVFLKDSLIATEQEVTEQIRQGLAEFIRDRDEAGLPDWADPEVAR